MPNLSSLSANVLNFLSSVVHQFARKITKSYCEKSIFPLLCSDKSIPFILTLSGNSFAGSSGFSGFSGFSGSLGLFSSSGAVNVAQGSSPCTSLPLTATKQRILGSFSYNHEIYLCPFPTHFSV